VLQISAPEPGTWMMMLGGFGIAGVALRRRVGRNRALA
jgi:PEP-CTERM motif